MMLGHPRHFPEQKGSAHREKSKKMRELLPASRIWLFGTSESGSRNRLPAQSGAIHCGNSFWGVSTQNSQPVAPEEMYTEACFLMWNFKSCFYWKTYFKHAQAFAHAQTHRDSSTLQEAINYPVALCLIGWASNLSWMIRDVVAKATEGNLPTQPYFLCVSSAILTSYTGSNFIIALQTFCYSRY